MKISSIKIWINIHQIGLIFIFGVHEDKFIEIYAPFFTIMINFNKNVKGKWLYERMNKIMWNFYRETEEENT